MLVNGKLCTYIQVRVNLDIEMADPELEKVYHNLVCKIYVCKIVSPHLKTDYLKTLKTLFYPANLDIPLFTDVDKTITKFFKIYF